MPPYLVLLANCGGREGGGSTWSSDRFQANVDVFYNSSVVVIVLPAGLIVTTATFSCVFS